MTSRELTPDFNYFYGYSPLHRLSLLGQPDLAHPSFADLAKQQVTVDRPKLRFIVRPYFRQTKRQHAGSATAIRVQYGVACEA